MTTPNARPDREPGAGAAERGLSLVELTTAVATLVILLWGLHTTLQASTQGRRTVDRIDRSGIIANDYMDRLLALPFGRLVGGASATQLQQLFDDDWDLGSVTLQELRCPAGENGHWFVASHDGIRGRWRIKVSGDHNGDGDETDAELREGRSDMVGIEVWFDQRLLAHTCRTAPVEDTETDHGARY